MNKKFVAIFAAVSFAVFGFALWKGFSDDDPPATRVSQRTISASAAREAADKMTRLCCGVVSGSDVSMEQSAFHTDFVPREPEYVERFRSYDGPTADFVPVYMYHFFFFFITQKPTKGSNSHSIQSVHVFLQWLWENGYVTLKMDELYEWLEGNIELPAKCVLLTSDDGQENFFELMQPELHQYGFVATSFVITGIRENIPYKLTLPNIELHSHTHNMHRASVEGIKAYNGRGIMQDVPVEYGVGDLKNSQEILNGSKYFAYPFGSFGGNSKEILRQAGFRLAFTIQGGVVHRGDDPLQLCRLRVGSSASLNSYRRGLRYDKVMEKYQ